jgi:hypothetical protein
MTFPELPRYQAGGFADDLERTLDRELEFAILEVSS